MVEDKEHPIIIGGGVAGLTAALHLAERGLRPVVLEKAAVHIGGRLAGGDEIDVDGHTFTLEHGVHGVWSPYVNLKAMLARYGADQHFVPATQETWIYRRHNRVYRTSTGRAIRNSWFPAPLHYFALFLRPSFLRILNWRDWLALPAVWYGLIFAVGIDPLREQQPLAGRSLDQYMRYWSPAVRAFCVGLARNSLSAQPEEIPLSGFIAFLRYYTLLRRDAWRFSYLSADAGTAVIDPLVARLQALGGRVQTGTTVTRLERTADRWRIHTAAGDTYTTAEPILAVDPRSARRILNASYLTPAPDSFYWSSGRDTAVIRLWYDRAPRERSSAAGGMFSGEFALDNFFWLHRLQDQYRAWHEQTGGAVVETHIYGPGDLLDRPDAALLAQAIGDVQAAFPELRGRLIHQHLQRNVVPHTLFGIGEAGQNIEVETPWPGLWAAGDWVFDPAPAFFLERAALTGLRATNGVLRARGERPFAIEPYPQPEWFAGKLEGLMQAGRRWLRARRR